MRTTVEMERSHHETLEAMLEPLGFQSVRLGVFAQRQHPWMHFDLTAIDPSPDVVLPKVMDMLWDHAKAAGMEAARKSMRDALGLK